MKIVTHSGEYHTDDVFAAATVSLIYDNFELIRSRDADIIRGADMVLDVGQEYDPQRLRFDHHQLGGAGKRSNGIPYATFGLVWKEYGERLCGTKEGAEIIEEKIVMPVDAGDNGVNVYESLIDHIEPYTVGDFLKTFLFGSQTFEDFDAAFNQAVDIAMELLRKEIEESKKKVKDWEEVRRLYAEAENKGMIVLPRPMSWQKVLIPTEAVFVLMKRIEGTWQVRGVPTAPHSYEVKSPLPSPWRGLENEELAKVTGVSDSVFCHNTGFLAVAKSKEGALKLAQIALNA